MPVLRLRTGIVPGVVLVLGVAVAGSLPAQERARAAPAVVRPHPVPLDTFSLSNGLRVAVSEDPSAPVVAVSLRYRVGSGHERPGERGFAHLFEHILLAGTGALDPGEAERLVRATGGTLEAATDGDRVSFGYRLPVHHLDLALWLEAERMGRLRISEPGLEAVRRLVLRERWLRLQGQPYGRAREVLDTLPGGYPPYAHPPWTVEDVAGATPDAVEAFVRRHFVPSNATLVVVGDVRPEEVRRRVEARFGAIPGGRPAPPLPPTGSAPGPGGARRVELTDPAAPAPLLYVAYPAPPADHPDASAVALLATLLGDEAGALGRRLESRGVAASTGAVLRTRAGPGLLVLAASPGAGVSVEEMEAALLDLVARLREEGPPPDDVARARARRASERVRSRLRVREKAGALQRLWHHRGDPFLINREAERHTAGEIARVLRTYLAPGRRIVVVVRAAAAGGEAGAR